MSQAFDGGEPTMPLASGETGTGTKRDIEIETERRRSPRSPLVVRVAYSTVDALFTEFTKNVNEGGLFIETESPPPLDTRVALEFKLPGTDAPIRARGRVAWLRAASPEEGPAGMGVEFEQLGSEARESIDALVRQLRTAGK
jgi:uncharacterized protein (TIGR02266 family)